MDLKINNILKTYGLSKPQSSTNKIKPEQASSGGKALEVSDSVMEYSNTLETVKNTSDIREDVVSKYKGLIDSGAYNVSVSDLADKLLGL